MNKKIIALLSIPIFGFLIFIIIHFTFLNLTKNVQKQAENLRVKQIISSDINYEIIKIKSYFYQAILLSNNTRSMKLNIELLIKEINKVKRLLNILQNGGVYNKVVPLNLVNKDKFEKKYVYVKTNEVSLEVIDLYPKIRFLENKVVQLDRLLSTMFTQNLTLKQFKQRRKRVIRFSKTLDSVFRRMIENSNRLFYESQMQLMKLENKLQKDILFYKNIEFGLIVFLIFIFILVGYIVIKELTKLNTELINRLYTDELTHAYSRKKLEDTEFTDNSVLILIDIDKFSEINELYGMDIGNKLLQEFAKRLKECSPKWQVFRLSADIFGLYIDDINKMMISIEDKIYNLRKRFMFESIEVDEYSIDVNITISVAFGKNAIHNAFAALSMAKENQVAFMIFTSEEEFKKKVEFNKKWQKEIKYAIAENRIEPFFQPIVDHNMNIIKYETLMRMKRIDGDKVEYVPPFFLDIAIKTKQYLTISKQMIEKTFYYFRNGGEFTINLNYLDMNSESMKDLLQYLITTYNAQNRVTFEILEDESIKDYQVVEDFISYFRQYGVKIAIDDFGSGYSNFKRIMTINPDYIKFDGSLIKNIHEDNYSYLIVQNLVKFAKSLNIKTIAEYVHNKEVFDTCIYLGVDYLQGYYISAPKKDI